VAKPKLDAAQRKELNALRLARVLLGKAAFQLGKASALDAMVSLTRANDEVQARIDLLE